MSPSVKRGGCTGGGGSGVGYVARSNGKQGLGPGEAVQTKVWACESDRREVRSQVHTCCPETLGKRLHLSQPWFSSL